MRKTFVVGIVGMVAIAGAIALLRPWLELREARARLLQQPMYQVLEKHEPDLFSRLAKRYRDLLGGKLLDPQFANIASAQISAAATVRLAHASDSAANALIREMVGTARELRILSGDACFRYWFPEVAGPAEPDRRLDPKRQQALFDALAEVIRSSAENPVPASNDPAVARNMGAVINEIYARFGTDAQMLAHTDDPRVDRDKVCTITIALYERVLARPPADSAALIRAMSQAR